MERGRCYCFPSVWSNSKVPKCLKNALLHTPVVKRGGKNTALLKWLILGLDSCVLQRKMNRRCSATEHLQFQSCVAQSKAVGFVAAIFSFSFFKYCM